MILPPFGVVYVTRRRYRVATWIVTLTSLLATIAFCAGFIGAVSSGGAILRYGGQKRLWGDKRILDPPWDIRTGGRLTGLSYNRNFLDHREAFGYENEVALSNTADIIDPGFKLLAQYHAGRVIVALVNIGKPATTPFSTRRQEIRIYAPLSLDLPAIQQTCLVASAAGLLVRIVVRRWGHRFLGLMLSPSAGPISPEERYALVARGWGVCMACGYDLRGSTSSPRCPECGTEIARTS